MSRAVGLGLILALMVVPQWAAAADQTFVVMLDPGHGGSNTGAAGVDGGVFEKRVTLALAKSLARRLEREPGLRVIFTRTDDRYLTLRERVRAANESGADVLVSLHANASPSRAQSGYETYVLSPEALDVDTRALRQDEGAPRPGIDPQVALVLDDMERGAALEWGIRLAGFVQKRLAAVRGDSGNRGVKQAAMDVLMGPVMPAVLVEVGFLDHPLEGRALLRPEMRAALAEAVALGILDYRELRARDPR